MKTKIKSISKILIFSLFLILTISCNKSEIENKSILPVTINPITIGKGSVNENPYSEPNFIIENNEDWQTLLNNFNTSNLNVTNHFTQTDIDFNNFEVIVAFYGSSSSFRVTISNVVENADYTSDFERFSDVSDIFMAGHFYGNDAPKILTRKMRITLLLQYNIVEDQ
jgi:hypothetical protein